MTNYLLENDFKVEKTGGEEKLVQGDLGGQWPGRGGVEGLLPVLCGRGLAVASEQWPVWNLKDQFLTSLVTE